jgi:hypothetical protein
VLRLRCWRGAWSVLRECTARVGGEYWLDIFQIFFFLVSFLLDRAVRIYVF